MLTPAQFADIVNRAFGPVLSTKAFAMVATDDFTVAFRSPSASLMVSYEEHSHELNVWLSDVNDAFDAPPLELPDALRATHCPASEVDSVTLIQAHDPEPVERLLRRVADVIRKYASPFLEGDRGSFDVGRRIRADRARAYTARIVDAPAIAEADTAWQARDYRRACEILGPMRDRLDDTHRRRLTFAERKLEDVS